MDAAALERFPRRIYVPLPDEKAAAEIARICVKGLDASGINFDSIARECTKRLFSGRDINNLCQQAVWNMIRDENKNLHELSKLDFEELANRALKTRPLREADFSVAFDNIKVSPKSKNLERYMKWAEDFGG
jgi:SpoVK/Ycf46/Vps4 family AAA+-type ATPase